MLAPHCDHVSYNFKSIFLLQLGLFSHHYFKFRCIRTCLKSVKRLYKMWNTAKFNGYGWPITTPLIYHLDFVFPTCFDLETFTSCKKNILCQKYIHITISHLYFVIIILGSDASEHVWKVSKDYTRCVNTTICQRKYIANPITYNLTASFWFPNMFWSCVLVGDQCAPTRGWPQWHSQPRYTYSATSSRYNCWQVGSLSRRKFRWTRVRLAEKYKW
jgi:hypothetical protein